MVRPEQVLAVVPARGGSKSLPRKNIRRFAGHPLLAYSIAAGKAARTVGRVLVSTDDPETAAIARRYGAEVPFLRPAELAQDETPDLPVFQHALRWLKGEEGYLPEVVVQLRPTSPLRPPGCVDEAVEILFADSEADSVRGVVPAGQNPYKMWRIDEAGRMRPLLASEHREPYNLPRQMLPVTYWQTGHIDAIRTTTITVKEMMSGETILPYILPAEYMVDIDTEWDWQRAERRIQDGRLQIIRPLDGPRSLPEKLRLVVLDFDGVLTDNRVWVDQEGRESIAANRSDGLGIARLKQHGIQIVVLSAEANPVVAARCNKLGVSLVQGVVNKDEALRTLLAEEEISADAAVYVGNDVNDLPCFPLVSFSVAVSDAHPEVLAEADMILSRRGGHGAVRELSDLILQRIVERKDRD